MEGMHRAAERGKSLNQQLLAFARRQPLKPEIANPNAVINGFEAVLRRACGEMITSTSRWLRAFDPSRSTSRNSKPPC